MSKTSLFTCTKCGNSYTEKVPKTEEHTYDKMITTEATCEQNGLATYTCSVCSDTYTETIPAKGHISDEGVITKKANFFVSGIKTYSCKTCGEVLKTEKILSGLQSLFDPK